MTRYWDIACEAYGLKSQIAPHRWERFLERLLAPRIEPVARKIIDPRAAAAMLQPAPPSKGPSAEWPKTVHCIGSLGAGGAERQLVNLVSELGRRGHGEQTLLTVYPLEGAGAHYAPLLAAEHVAVRTNNSPIREEGVALIRQNPDVIDLIARISPEFQAWTLDLWVELSLLKPDVAHLWLDHTNIWGAPAALLADVPAVILSTRNVHPENFPYLYATYMKPWYVFLERCPRVHFINNSHAGAASYAEWIGADVSRFDVILNGVDLTHLSGATADERAAIRAEIGLPNDVHAVVGAFRFSEEKRPLLFVDTFAKAAAEDPNLHAVLMGDGPLRAKTIARAAELGLSERFHAIGQRADLPKVLSSMDVFLHTAWWEGTPNVVLEAQQLQLPVVVTNGGGAADAVDHGRTGLLVDRADEPALANALKVVLSELDVWRRRARSGPDFIAARFGIERMVDETLAFQRAALSGDWPAREVRSARAAAEI